MKKFQMLAALIAAFVVCAGAQVTGPIQAKRVKNTACSNGQVGSYDASGRLSGCVDAGGGSGGYATIQQGGTALTQRTILNLLQGTGIILSCSDTGTKTECAYSIDFSSVLSGSEAQAGTPWYCRSTTGNDAYGCTTNPASTSTTLNRGQFVLLDPDTLNTGAATISIGGGTVRSIVLNTGSDPAYGAIPANRGTLLYWNGTAFSIVGGSGSSTSNSIFNPLSAVVAAQYTSWNAASTTIDTSVAGKTLLSTTADNASGGGVFKAISGNFDQQFAVVTQMRPAQDTSVGAFLTDGTKASSCWIQFSSGNGGFQWRSINWNTATSYSGEITQTAAGTIDAAGGMGSLGQRLMFFRFRNDGTNTSCQYSPDGWYWQVVWTRASGTFLTPTGAGILVTSPNGSTNLTKAVIVGAN